MGFYGKKRDCLKLTREVFLELLSDNIVLFLALVQI